MLSSNVRRSGFGESITASFLTLRWSTSVGTGSREDLHGSAPLGMGSRPAQSPQRAAAGHTSFSAIQSTRRRVSTREGRGSGRERRGRAETLEIFSREREFLHSFRQSLLEGLNRFR